MGDAPTQNHVAASTDDSTSYLGQVQIERLSGAAEEGDAESQMKLALVLANEYETSGDKELQQSSEKWLRLAAAQGLPEAQHHMGDRFREGSGVVQDFSQAARWYQQAADQGFAGSMYALGEMMRVGQGVAQSYADAYIWLNLAAARGDVRAQDAREQIVTLLSTAQLNDAQRHSRELDEAIPRYIE
ncbi:MAG: tetratricopeptide repeat protein [Pseudomonadota bacterium]